MRVCLVCSAEESRAGPTMTAARAWRAGGHETHVVVTGGAGWPVGAAQLGGVQLHRVDIDSGVLGKPGWQGDDVRRAMGVNLCLHGLEADRPLDYIEAPLGRGMGFFVCRARRTLGAFPRAVLSLRLETPQAEVRAGNRDSRYGLDEAYLDHMERASLEECDLVISPTRGMLGRFTPDPDRSRPARIVVPPPRAPLRSKSAAGGEGMPTVLCPTPLEWRMGAHVLAEAARRLLDGGVEAKFVFTGADTETAPFGGSMREVLLARLGGTRPDRVQFRPGAPGDADIWCLPALADCVPGPIFDGLSRGVCVIASGRDADELIEDGVSGLLPAAGDAAALADALGRVIADEALRRGLAGAGAERAAEMCDGGRAVRTIVAAVERVRGVGRGERVGVVDDPPLVSVIVPFHNLGRFLPETIRSVRRQTYPHHELIVVDDGSTDPGSVEVVRRTAAADRSIRLIRQANAGLGAARNAGLAAARGRYYIPLDADDMLDPTFIEKTLGVMRGDPELAYVSTLVRYFRDDPAQATGCWMPLGLERHILPVANCGGTPASMFDLQKVRDLGGYDTARTGFEDWDLYSRLAMRGERATVIPELLFYYRHRDDSMYRVFCLPNQHRLRAYLCRRHEGLSDRPELTMRLLLSEVQRLTREIRWHRRQIELRERAIEDQARDSGIAEMKEERDALAARVAVLEAWANGSLDPAALARAQMAENIRYRLADVVNNTLKSVGLHRPLKAIASRTIRGKTNA